MLETSADGKEIRKDAAREEHIKSLLDKHSELEMALRDEEARPMPDSLAIASLKRKKLAIKDEIAQLRHG